MGGRKLVAAAICIVACSTASAQSEAQLKYACKQFVERSLHDPRSAELDWTNAKFGRTKEGNHIVRFRGRAKNAYNALRLATFECVIRYTPPDNFNSMGVKVF